MIAPMLYPHLLAFHGALRWVALIAAIVAFSVAASGWSGTTGDADVIALRYTVCCCDGCAISNRLDFVFRRQSAHPNGV